MVIERFFPGSMSYGEVYEWRGVNRFDLTSTTSLLPLMERNSLSMGHLLLPHGAMEGELPTGYTSRVTSVRGLLRADDIRVRLVRFCSLRRPVDCFILSNLFLLLLNKLLAALQF